MRGENRVESVLRILKRCQRCEQTGLLEEPREGDETVRQVVAIVKPYLAEKVLENLRRAPLEGLSVTEVKGFGRQKSYLDEYAKTEYAEVFLPKVEITMWVEDARLEEVLQKVILAARSGRMGDGKIFVMPVTSYL